MSKKRTSNEPKNPRQEEECEWSGGIARFPLSVTEAGESSYPEMLVWMEGSLSVGSDVTAPGEALSMACDSLRHAMASPLVGEPRKPTRIRVASEALAEVLREGMSAELPGLEVLVAPTPMIDATVEEMAAHMEEVEVAYALPSLCAEMDTTTLGSYFAGAAGLFRAEPTMFLPEEGALFGVSIPELGMDDGVMSAGAYGGRLRLVLFESAQRFADYLNLDGAEAYGEEIDGAVFDSAEFDNEELGDIDFIVNVALGFENRNDIPEETAEEIDREGWVVAAEDAYPEWVILEAPPGETLPGPALMQAADAATRALTLVLADPELPDAWATDTPVSRSFVVDTHHGPLSVQLTTPLIPENSHTDLIGDLVKLDLEGDEDTALREELEEVLFDEFEASPEGQGLAQEIRTLPAVADLAAKCLGVSFATMGAGEFYEVLFDLMPRSVCMPPAEAANAVDELRAFYRFLRREYHLEQAEPCLSILTPETVEALEASLGNEELFDPVKRVIEEGRKRGFDVDSSKGADAWLEVLRAEAEHEASRTPSKVSKAQAAKRKAKRKASRKARRKKR